VGGGVGGGGGGGGVIEGNQQGGSCSLRWLRASEGRITILEKIKDANSSLAGWKTVGYAARMIR